MSELLESLTVVIRSYSLCQETCHWKINIQFALNLISVYKGQSGILLTATKNVKSEALLLSQKGKLLLFPNLHKETKPNSNALWIERAGKIIRQSTRFLMYQPLKRIFYPRVRKERNPSEKQMKQAHKILCTAGYSLSWAVCLNFISCLSFWKAFFLLKSYLFLKTVSYILIWQQLL